MFGILRHVVPVVSLFGIVGVVGVTVLFFFAHEGPLFVKLHFTGIRGKKPLTRRVRRGHARPQGGCSGSRRETTYNHRELIPQWRDSVQ